jgi:hypothetical protein
VRQEEQREAGVQAEGDKQQARRIEDARLRVREEGQAVSDVGIPERQLAGARLLHEPRLHGQEVQAEVPEPQRLAGGEQREEG